MATITSTIQLTMQNDRYGITSETTSTAEVRSTPAPTFSTITNSIENGAVTLVYNGVFDPSMFDPTFQDNTAGITTINGYQEFLTTDSTQGVTISGWVGETFDSLFAPDFALTYVQADSITSGAFDDMLRGYGGDDTINGGAGNDTVIGGSQISDSTDGSGAGAQQLFGGLGSDSIYGGAALGGDIIYGGQGRADRDDSADFIEGYFGADTIFGNAGNDTIYGELAGAGQGLTDLLPNELIYGGQGSDQIFGQGGDDILAGGGGLAHPNDQADTISGGLGNDTITGNGDNDSIDGDAGNDSIFGGLGNDVIDGGADNDAIMGLKGDDFLTGGSGADIFHFRAGDGNDTILDFDAGTAGTAVDILQLDSNLGVSSFAELQTKAVEIEGNTIYAFDDGTIILVTGVIGIAQEDVNFLDSSTFFAPVFALGF